MTAVDARGGFHFDADDSAGGIFKHEIDFVAVRGAEMEEIGGEFVSFVDHKVDQIQPLNG